MSGTTSRDSWIPKMFLAGFLVVIVANATMAGFAFSSWTGIATEDAYRKGLAYNATLHAARAQAAAGWQGDVAYTVGDAGRGRLEFTLRDRAGRPAAVEEVRAAFVRPTHEGFDFEFVLPPLGPGRYAATVDLPLPGMWDIRIAATRGAETLRFEQRIVVGQ